MTNDEMREGVAKKTSSNDERFQSKLFLKNSYLSGPIMVGPINGFFKEKKNIIKADHK